MVRFATMLGRYSPGKLLARAISLGLIFVVTSIDFYLGPGTHFFFFYILVVAHAVWFGSPNFGVLISFLSAAAWVIGYVISGGQYTSWLILIWNGAIFLSIYLIIVGMLARLQALHMSLEEKVRQRTEALTAEIAKRSRLQQEILEISERERRRIGYELHDSVSQHLTGTALAGQVLADRLAAQKSPEEDDARRIVRLVEEGISLTRDIARGLQPVEIQGEAFVAAFKELALNTRERFRVACDLVCEGPLAFEDEVQATQLYRIAQEAVFNAARHGKPTRIEINLQAAGDEIILTVRDNGVGLPEDGGSRRGMGFQIMRYRATLMDAALEVRSGPTGGTSVSCTVKGGVRR